MTHLRRGVVLLLVIGALPTLTACVAPVPPQLTVGACLRTTAVEYSAADVVPCSADHFADYLGGTTWPGFDGVIATHGAQRTFDAIYHDASDSFVADYKGWTQRACNDHLDRIADVDWVSDDLSDYYPHIDELGLVPVGPFTIEAALGTRAEFLAGDHATRCRLTWVDSNDVATRVPAASVPGCSTRTSRPVCGCASPRPRRGLCAGKHTQDFRIRRPSRPGNDFQAVHPQRRPISRSAPTCSTRWFPPTSLTHRCGTSMIRTPAWRDAGLCRQTRPAIRSLRRRATTTHSSATCSLRVDRPHLTAVTAA